MNIQEQEDSIIIGPFSKNGFPTILFGHEIASKIFHYSTSEEHKLKKIFIDNLRINGIIDISNNSASINFPPIYFKNCIMSGVDLSCTNCSRIEIFNSQITVIMAKNIHVEFGIYIYSVRYCRLEFGAKDAIPLFNFHGCVVNGDFTIHDLGFEDDKMSPILSICHSKIASRLYISLTYAQSLDIISTDVDGDFHICNKSKISSKVSAANFYVKNHFYISDSIIGSPDNLEAYSFSGEGVTVGGAILIWNSHTFGEFNIIHGNIDVNIEFKSSIIRSKRDNHLAIRLTGVSIKGDLRFENESNVFGCIDISHAKIGGKLLVSGTIFKSRNTKTSLPFDARFINISGSLQLENSIFGAGISFARSRIAGDVEIKRISFNKKENHEDLKGPSPCINFLGSIVDGEVLIQNISEENGYCEIMLEGIRFGLLRIPIYSDKSAFYKLSLVHFERLLASNTNQIDTTFNFIRSNAITCHKVYGYFDPQPFYHLAGHLQSMGWSREAENVIIKLKTFRRKYYWNPIRYTKSFLYGILFSYGYSWKKPSVIILAWILIGIYGTYKASETNQLVLDTKSVSSVASLKASENVAQSVFPVLPKEASIATNIPCGDNIEPIFFAIELILPIFDLGQKNQCTIRNRNDTETDYSYKYAYFWWWLAKYIYVIGGWILISLLVLTIAGTLKDNISDKNQ